MPKGFFSIHVFKFFYLLATFVFFFLHVQAMEKGQNDIARIYAENAVRQKTQSVNFLKLSSRMDAVAVRVQAASNMTMVSLQMIFLAACHIFNIFISIFTDWKNYERCLWNDWNNSKNNEFGSGVISWKVSS